MGETAEEAEESWKAMLAMMDFDENASIERSGICFDC